MSAVGCIFILVIFPSTDSPLCTDELFSQLAHEHHRTGRSPLLDTPVNLVSQFPLDYMHLICLGVTHRLIMLWKKGPFRSTSQNLSPDESMIEFKGRLGWIQYMPKKNVKWGIKVFALGAKPTINLYTGKQEEDKQDGAAQQQGHHVSCSRLLSTVFRQGR